MVAEIVPQWPTSAVWPLHTDSQAPDCDRRGVGGRGMESGLLFGPRKGFFSCTSTLLTCLSVVVFS